MSAWVCVCVIIKRGGVKGKAGIDGCACTGEGGRLDPLANSKGPVTDPGRNSGSELDRLRRAAGPPVSSATPASNFLQRMGALNSQSLYGSRALANPISGGQGRSLPPSVLGNRAFAIPPGRAPPRSSAPAMQTHAALRTVGLPQTPDANMRAAAATMQQDHRRDIRAEKSVCNAATTALIERCLQWNWDNNGREGTVPEHVVNVFLKGRAVSTLENYAVSWKRWEDFCGADGIEKCFPVTPWDFTHMIALETTRLDVEGKTASSIDNLVSAVVFFCEKVAGCDNPMADAIASMTVGAARKYLGYQNRPKDPILQEHIRSIWKLFGGPEATLTKVATLLKVSATQEGLLRWDDLAALHAGHFLFSDDPDAPFRAFLIHSKTDQWREGQWSMFSSRNVPWSTQQLLIRTLQMVSDAWESMTVAERKEHTAWADENGDLQLTKMPLVFSTVELESGMQFPKHPEIVPPGKKVSAQAVKTFVKQQYASFRSYIKVMMSTAGIPGDFSVHSGRRGGTTELFKAGCSERLIKAAGRWRTDKAMNRYIDDEHALRLHAGIVKKLRFPEEADTAGFEEGLHLEESAQQLPAVGGKKGAKAKKAPAKKAPAKKAEKNPPPPQVLQEKRVRKPSKPHGS